MDKIIDICQVVFDVAHQQIADDDGEYNELMERLKDLVDHRTFDEIDQVCNFRVFKAQAAGFKVGWQMRGMV
jgi:hypothetical protein